MEHSPAKDPSPAPATTSKGFKSVIAKARIGRKDDSSGGSVPDADDSSDRTAQRNSLDSLSKNGTRTSLDENQPSGGSKISKLIPKRIKKKLEQREEAERQLQAEEEDARGRSVEDSAATSAGSAQRSGSTLADDEGNSSLLTVESGSESPAAVPPPLSSHDSHIGYLTSSSPLVKTTPTPDSPDVHPLQRPELHYPQYQIPKSSTLPTENKQSLPSNLAPRHANTINDRETQGSLGRSDRSTSRGVSPGARIKDVFSVGSRRKGVSPSKSPSRPSMTPEGNGNGNGLTGYMKQKAVNIGNGAAASESLQSPGSEPSKSAPSSRGDLTSLSVPPQTPSNAGIEAPETLVTPPTPTDRRQSQDQPPSPSLKSKPVGVVSASGNMISHRRARSDSATHAPSRLSQAMAPPMTPMAEEVKTTVSQPGSPGGGFFSSMFSAAQNMTNQLTSTIANNPPRPKSSVQEREPQEMTEMDDSSDVVDDVSTVEKKPLAIDTLGSGELSLSHLGIDTPATANSTNGSFTNGGFERDSGVLVKQEEAAARSEDASAARAVSQAYSEKPLTEQATPVANDSAPVLRPRSIYESSIAAGDKTPPAGSIYESENGVKRSGSVRSRVGAVARRHRNSSSATAGTNGAVTGASHSVLANPLSSGSTTKLTGFAVASKKRNRDFHQLFRSVPEDDYLIEDYSCALQRDIILAGRIYVSEGHICFSSNILGWVTTLVISFDEVVSVEKENTAMVFPNAIAIQTLHARHTFRSLLSREATYELLIGIWKLSHPSLKSSLNGVRLDNAGTGDKTEKVDPSASDEVTEISEEEEEVYDEDDEEGEAVGSVTEGGNGSIAGSEDPGESAIKPAMRKVSTMGVAVGAAAAGVPTATDAKAGEKAAVAAAATADFPGPATHEPTECSDSATHYDKVLKDDVIPAPLGKVYSMVFGSASGGFMAKWLIDDIKVTDLQNMEDDKKGLAEQGSSRSYSYIKPLNAPIGPKTTKCLVTETVDFMDYEKSVSVTASTQTPDVPSGNIFVTKTRFCFMWAPGNQTRVLMNYTLEWSGKSWIKGAIEKGATDGQGTYCNDLVKALKAGISRPRTGTAGSKTGKPTKNGKRLKVEPSSKSLTSTTVSEPAKKDDSWGVLEPLHGILGPVGDILSPFISQNMIIGFLLFIILFNYFRSSFSSRATSSGLSHIPNPERLAAYEAIWQREEADLWDWLDERVHAHRGARYPVEDQETLSKAKRVREKAWEDKTAEGIRGEVKGSKMRARELEEAIRVTEERLGVLKEVVAEEKKVKEDDGGPVK